MSDVADILGLDVPQSNPMAPPLPGLKKRKASETPEAQAAKKKARTGGLSREVRLLTEGQTVAAPEPKRLAVKEKRRLERRVRKWSSTRTLVSGRDDALSLTRWTRADHASAASARDSKASRAPKSVSVLRWGEYGALPVTARWSEALTVRLCDLVQRYDSRWPIVFDRWTADRTAHDPDEGAPAFTVEDLKERYYAVQRALTRALPSALPPVEEYNKAQDVRRKRQLSVLAAAPALSAGASAALERWQSLRRAQAKQRSEAVRVFKVAAQLLAHSSDATHGLAAATKARGGRLKAPPRSILDEKSGIVAAKHAVSVAAALAELGVRRPEVASVRVSEKYNCLRDCLAVLAELQRLNAEAAYDVAVLKAHKTALRAQLRAKHGRESDVPDERDEPEQTRAPLTLTDASAMLLEHDEQDDKEFLSDDNDNDAMDVDDKDEDDDEDDDDDE